MSADNIRRFLHKISELEEELSDALGREDELSLTIEALESENRDLQERLAELGGEAYE